ncbi:hypothetical protein ACIP88_00540 [Streptomyces uncialis]|uniref:AraC-like ligand-binding domain-containing protein n=1 Tax=Streptomyces uncialis TaxID=1048205 RepID=UPI00381E23CA
MAFTEFDTARLPQEQRFDWWREVVSQGVAPARITSEAACDFTGSVGTLGLGRVQLTTMSFPALRSDRTPEFIRRADPETYELTLILGGEMGFAQGRDGTRLSAGDITISSIRSVSTGPGSVRGSTTSGRRCGRGSTTSMETSDGPRRAATARTATRPGDGCIGSVPAEAGRGGAAAAVIDPGGSARL